MLVHKIHFSSYHNQTDNIMTVSPPSNTFIPGVTLASTTFSKHATSCTPTETARFEKNIVFSIIYAI